MLQVELFLKICGADAEQFCCEVEILLEVSDYVSMSK